MKSLFIRIVFIAFLFSQLAGAQGVRSIRTIILVRHAEQAPGGALTPAGEKRAECLAQMLKDAGVRQIYVADTQATQQTAAPLAKALKLTPTIVPAKDPNRLISNLAYAGGAGNVLVVAQSDTLPFVLARMKAGSIPALREDEYDRMFAVTEMEGAASPVTTLHYCGYGPGAASPKPAATPKPATRSAPKKR